MNDFSSSRFLSLSERLAASEKAINDLEDVVASLSKRLWAAVADLEEQVESKCSGFHDCNCGCLSDTPY